MTHGRMWARLFLRLAIAVPAFFPLAVRGFDVSPVRQEIALSPGQSRTVEYAVTNTGSQAETIAVQAVEWRRYPWNQKMALKDWLDLAGAAQPLALGPQEAKKITVRVRCPEQASGELVAMIYFSSAQPEAQVRVKYGVSLYLLVNGTIRTEYALEQAEVRVSPWDQQSRSATLTAAVTLVNKGNIHLRPRIEGRLEKAGLKFTVPCVFGQPVFPNERTGYQGAVCVNEPVPAGRYQVRFHIQEDRLAEAWIPCGEVKVEP